MTAVYLLLTCILWVFGGLVAGAVWTCETDDTKANVILGAMVLPPVWPLLAVWFVGAGVTWAVWYKLKGGAK